MRTNFVRIVGVKTMIALLCGVPFFVLQTSVAQASDCCETTIFATSGDAAHSWYDLENVTANDDAYAYTDVMHGQYVAGLFNADAFSCIDPSTEDLSDYTVTMRVKVQNPGLLYVEIGWENADASIWSYWIDEDILITDTWMDMEIPMSAFVNGEDDTTNVIPASLLQSGDFDIYGTFNYSDSAPVEYEPGVIYVDSISIASEDFVPAGYVCEGEATAPVIETGLATDITSDSATLTATVTDDGGETPTVEFAWGTEPGTYTDTCTPVTNDGDEYSCDLSGLSSGTTYYVLASATNSEGTGSGSETSFQTAAAASDDDDDNNDSDDETEIGDKACKPRKLSAKERGDGHVKLTWKKPCGLIDTIAIERRKEGGAFEVIATTPRAVNEYIDDRLGLSSGAYTYRIRGYRTASGRYSRYSDKKSVTIDRSEDSDSTEPEEPDLLPETIETPPATPVQRTSDSESAPTEEEPKPDPSILGEAVEAARRFLERYLTAMTTVAIAGFLAGAAVFVSPTGIPFFATSPTPLGDFISKSFRIFGFFGKKKPEDDWGIVFDSETKRPLAGVPVSIINEDGRTADTSVTDAQGRYGFLPGSGNYTLGVSKKGYELEKSERQDMLYGELYTGQTITVESHDMKKVSIALRATEVDWQDFARRKVSAYTSTFSIVKRDAFLILFYAGFVINIGIVSLFPSVLNIVLLIVYLGMLAHHLFFRRKKYGLITNTQTGQPVPFTMVSLHEAADSGQRVSFAVSDVLGRYFMLVKNGEYLLRVSGSFLGGVPFEKMARIRVRDGVIRRDMKV